MANPILSIAAPAQAELIEKKSRFIANIFPVDTEEAAAAALAQIRRQYKDANHHVYAMQIGSNNQIQRSNDDGEPAGTGGRPILEAIKHQNLQNTLIIVTRYFGGVLLGSGGLVRAYGKSAALAIDAAQIIKLIPGQTWAIHFDYPLIAKIEILLNNQSIQIAEKSYLDKVCFLIKIPTDLAPSIIEQLNNLANGNLHSQCLLEEMIIG